MSETAKIVCEWATEGFCYINKADFDPATMVEVVGAEPSSISELSATDVLPPHTGKKPVKKSE